MDSFGDVNSASPDNDVGVARSSREFAAASPQHPSGFSPLALVAVVGRRDQPTDAVREYCEHLSQAFARRGDSLQVAELRWEVHGWLRTLRTLCTQSRAWRGRVVLLQYTALMWSRRGFALPALAVLAILRIQGVRFGVVFHDVQCDSARRIIHRLRVACQNVTIRILFRCAEFPVFTVPLSQVKWLPRGSDRAFFVPVGTNFPLQSPVEDAHTFRPVPTIAVFGITYGEQSHEEVRDIAHVIRRAASGFSALRLVCFGRGSAEAAPALQRELAGANVFFSALGVLPSEELRRNLLEADVMLCVRGHISTRRGSAIAGIVCGIPVVGYAGPETAAPITDAGVLLVSNNDRDALAQALAQLLTDDRLYADLRRRNLAAAREYFSWDAIASQFSRALSGEASAASSSVQDSVRGGRTALDSRF